MLQHVIGLQVRLNKSLMEGQRCRVSQQRGMSDTGGSTGVVGLAQLLFGGQDLKGSELVRI